MKATLLSSVLLFAAWFTTTTAQAVPCVLLTQSNGLITLDSTSPGTASAAVAITGLGAFTLVGIDVRTTVQTVGPANPGVGTIWALGVNGANRQLFVINPATAAATAVGPVLTGITAGDGDNGWYFGHDPGKDRFRIMNAQNNYELNPNNLTFVQQANVANFPNVNGSAFATASFGETTPIFFVNQIPNDTLCTSKFMSTGFYTNVGNTGLNFILGSGLDIAGNTTLLATTVGVATLYNVNRATGAATVIGTINGNPAIRALAIRPATFPRRLPVTVRVNGPLKIETSLPVVTIRGTAACQAGIKGVEFRVGNSGARKAKGKTRWTARIALKRGPNVVNFRATGNNLIRSRPARVSIIRE